MIKKRFFDKDPKVEWKKIRCPVCGEPTGEKSKCYEIEEENIKQVKSPVSAAILPVYSIDCYFRKNNLWEVNFNYPINIILMEKIKHVEGIEHILIQSNYSLQLSFAKLYNENEIKKNVNIHFITHIKEMSAIEIDTGDHQNDEPDIKGIIFPNGTKFIPVTNEEKLLARKILDDFPRVKEV